MLKELFTFCLKSVLFLGIVWGGFVFVTANGWLPNLPPAWQQALNQAQGIAGQAGAITGNIKGVAQAVFSPFTLANTVASKAPSPPPIPVPVPNSGGGGLKNAPDPALRVIGNVFKL